MILVAIIGLCFGLLAASGVLTVLLAVGLLPRYIGRLHEAKHIFLFENLVILGTMAGTFVSLFGEYVDASDFYALGTSIKLLYGISGILIESLYGLFAGVFVGTLALAIAEMLDAFPIFFRRARVGNGHRIIILAVAFGKVVGAFLYFYLNIGGNHG